MVTSIASPVVSVIISTYNWSSVLRYAIQSALWQTFQEFELLVVGDGCTDDSEQVVASFGDSRIIWFNLPENSGSQSAPNNKGIELAKGAYFAHLGHDDVWHPTHLQVLIHALRESGADFAYTLCDLVHPDDTVGRMVTGLTTSGKYEPYTTVPPSSWMYKREVATKIGGWRDHRTTRLPIDADFTARVWEQKLRFVPVYDITVFKFPSGWRKNSYIDKPFHQQADFAQQIQMDPELRYKELLKLVSEPARMARAYQFKVQLSRQAVPGYMVQYYRVIRGLVDEESLRAFPLEQRYDVVMLYSLNLKNDITASASRQWLFERHELPEDGILIGFEWYDLVQNEYGVRFRWVNNDAELVITRPTGKRRMLKLELMSGPGIDQNPFQLTVFDENNARIASLEVQHRKIHWVDLPEPLVFSGRDYVVIRLHAEVEGKPLETDPRILTFAVFMVDWLSLEEEDAQTRFETLDAQIRDYERKQPELVRQIESQRDRIESLSYIANQLEQFRTTSLGYWLYRIRTSPKLRRWLSG